jgi:hypothetical protein
MKSADIESLNLLEKAEALQNVLLARATGEPVEDGDYALLRSELIAEPELKVRLPRFITTCRDLGQFWQFIKTKFATYRERREYIWDEFRPCLEYLESGQSSPTLIRTSDVLEAVSSEHVQAAWTRALERRERDPEGAITAARTLLESVCKHILDEKGETYGDHADLPALYGAVASTLNLAPSQHTEKVFKQILGGCHSVVEGLGALRNRLGDAHGKGKHGVRPGARHAALTVNLAGTMATFLVETWEAAK